MTAPNAASTSKKFLPIRRRPHLRPIAGIVGRVLMHCFDPSAFDLPETLRSNAHLLRWRMPSGGGPGRPVHRGHAFCDRHAVTAFCVHCTAVAEHALMH